MASSILVDNFPCRVPRSLVRDETKLAKKEAWCCKSNGKSGKRDYKK